VNVGSVVKVDIYWDAIGAPTTFETDQLPYNGKIYKHLYPNFQTPLTKTFTIRFKSYSGETCVDDTTQTITVNAAPKVRFNIIPDACQYILPFPITQASEIGGVPGTFVFTGQGITSAGVYNPVLNGSGTFNLHYVYTSTAGCADSADQPIKILQPPIANYGYSLPTCEKKQVLFTDSSTAPVGNLTTWTWNFGDGTPILVRNTNTSFNHVFTTPGIYNVILFVTTNDGCNSKTKVVEIDIHPEPLAKFEFSDTACLPNAKVLFTNTSTIPDGTVSTLSYTWNFGDPASGMQNNTSTAINPNHIFTTTGPYNVTLNVVSINGCKDDSIIRVNTIHPQPKANFNFSKPSVCIGDNVRFIDASDPKDGTTSQWHWTFDDGTSSIQTSPIHTYTNVGNFSPSLFIVNSFGCNSDTINNPFEVYAYPVISAGPDLLILEGATMPLQATASGNQLQYLWTSNQYLNNDHLLNPLCTPMDDITYTLTVTGEGGCPSIDQMKVKILRKPIIPNTFSPNNDGINDTWEIDYLKFYPKARIQVFTRTGKLVFESKAYLKPWDGTKSGIALPLDTYYYIIEPESGRKPITGFITIIK
jgi:gliding motility-associated-like protein